MILKLTKKEGNMFKKIAPGCWVTQGRTPTYVLCFEISDAF